MNILDQYAMSGPSAQNAVDIFKGEWASKLPDGNPLAGSSLLFEDARIEWFAEQLGGFRNKTVLELGPLEAGHTYMLERLGAASILSVEANTRAFLKCLIIKEVFDLRRARFLCGDFIEYLRANQQQFHVCLASGVLYHMTDPVELIALLAKTTDHVCLWTHYYHPELGPSGSRQSAEYAGFAHTVYRMSYGGELNLARFCGGGRPYRCWMAREDIIKAFQHFGLTEITIGFDHRDHPNGPAFAMAASRPSGSSDA